MRLGMIQFVLLTSVSLLYYTAGMSIKLSERNEALYADWKQMKAGKMKMWELIAKYHISVTRINYLVNRMRLEDVQPRPDDKD